MVTRTGVLLRSGAMVGCLFAIHLGCSGNEDGDGGGIGGTGGDSGAEGGQAGSDDHAGTGGTETGGSRATGGVGGSRGGRGSSGRSGAGGSGDAGDGAGGNGNAGDGAGAGAAGEGGRGPDPRCDDACTRTDCCAEISGFSCTNDSMGEVVVKATLPPEVPANVKQVGEAVQVTFCSPNGPGLELRFEAGESDPRQMLVVRVEEDGRLLPQAGTFDDDSLYSTVSLNGTYAAIEIPPPDRCNSVTVTGTFDANNDADLSLLNGVTHLDGFLWIGGTVTNLDALACLTSVSKILVITGAQSLTNVNLDALTAVGAGEFGGTLMVSASPNLERVSFANLSIIGSSGNESIRFEDLPKLQSLAIPNLVDVPGSVHLRTLGNVDEPVALDLGKLETVGEMLGLEGIAGLSNLDTLASLKAIGALELLENPDLVDIDALSNLRTVEGGIHVSDTPVQRVNLPLLATLGTRAGEGFACSRAPELTSIDFRSLREISGDLQLVIVGADANAPLELNFSSLERVGGALHLEFVPHLETLDAFQALTAVTNRVFIKDTPLTQTEGLSNLRQAGTVSAWNNAFLGSIDLPSLQTARATFEFVALPRLANVDLGALSEVAGSFVMSDTGAAAGAPLTLNLGALTSIARPGLRLINVSNLASFADFRALRTVFGSLDIVGNHGITSLQHLVALETVNEDLFIAQNSMLPTCEAWWLHDRLLANGFDGYVTISENLSDACE